MNNKNYVPYSPFKLWTIQNFPFIEADFDAITNYQLYSKIVEVLNQVITNQNTLQNSNNELINAYNELVNYVNSYFENLDVQDEINNKLDEMAESGELTDIIAQYLQLAGVLAYDTITDMSDAANLVDGSICYTLGQNTYNDGKGAFYKVREIINTDVVDGFNIVALDASNELIAERMPNYYINELLEIIGDLSDLTTANKSSVTSAINELNSDQYLFIGDSYGMPSADYNWVDTFNLLAGLTNNVNSFNLCRGAAGFVSDSTNTYYNNLVNNISSIPDKTLIKHVIICGGWNDRGSVYDYSSITPIQTLVDYIKTNFPNAKIYCGMISNYKAIDDTAGDLHWREIIAKYLYPYYKEIENCGGVYLNGVETVMHNYNYFDSDNIHPNEDGAEALGRAIFQAVKGGYYINNKRLAYNISINSSSQSFTLESGVTGNLAGYYYIVNNEEYIKYLGTLSFSTPIVLTGTSKQITLATYNNNLPNIRYVDENSDINLNVRVTDSNSDEYYVLGTLNFNRDGKAYLTLKYDSSLAGKSVSSVSITNMNVKYLLWV